MASLDGDQEDRQVAPELHSKPNFPSCGWPCVPQTLCFVAAIVCFVDMILVTNMVRSTMKKALGIEGEAAAAAPAKEEPGQQQPQEPQQEPKSQPGKPPSPVSSEPAAVGSLPAKEAEPSA